MSCSKKRKRNCYDDCYWIKGKGCLKKRYMSPKWEGILDEKITYGNEKLPLQKNKEDSSEAKRLKNSGLEWLYRKYSTANFKVCVIWDERDRKTFERFQWIDFTKLPINSEMLSGSEKSIVEKFGRRKLLYAPEKMMTTLHNCLEMASDIIIIPFHLEIYIPEKKRFSRHANIIVINKFLRTIEFYDSNGWYFHKKHYKNEDVPELKRFFRDIPELQRYRLVLYKNLPEQGFQSFESRESQRLGERGKCMFWSLFIAELRIKYYRIDPVEMMEKILKQISDEHKSKEYNEFIKGYINYLKRTEEGAKNIQLTELLTPGARGAYKPKRKETPIWYISRRADMDSLTILAERYLEEKYKKSRKVCLVYNPEDLSDIVIWSDFSLLSDEQMKLFKEEEPTLVKKLRGQRMGIYISDTVWKSLEKCIRSDSRIVLFPISCRKTKKVRDPTHPFDFHRHRIIVIINKETKSIEMYDPNGSKSHKDMFDDADVPYITELFKSIPEFKDFYIFTYRDTFYRGFQSYQAEAKAGTKTYHLERGVCAIWTTFIADIRAKYSHLPVYKFTGQILDSIEPDDRPEFFKRLIEDYLTYLEKKLGYVL